MGKPKTKEISSINTSLVLLKNNIFDYKTMSNSYKKIKNKSLTLIISKNDEKLF